MVIGALRTRIFIGGGAKITENNVRAETVCSEMRGKSATIANPMFGQKQISLSLSHTQLFKIISRAIVGIP